MNLLGLAPVAGDPRRHPDAPAGAQRRLALFAARVRAVLARRPLHLQLPAAARRARCRSRRSATAPTWLVYPALMAGLLILAAPPHAARRPRQRDRRGDHDGRPRAAVVDLADRPRTSTIDSLSTAGRARLGRLSARRRPAARRWRCGSRSTAASGAPAFHLMSASIICLLVTDFVYGLMILHGTYDHQLWLDAGWIGFYLLWGAAALHPSMSRHRPAGREARRGAHPLPPRAADRRLAHRARDRDRARPACRRLRLRCRARRRRSCCSASSCREWRASCASRSARSSANAC